MSARVYVPTTLAGLAGFVSDGSVPQSAPRITAADDSEESEYSALMEAAVASAALLTGAGRRVVVVAEVADSAGDIAFERVVAVHVDTEDDADEDDDLAWFATQEIPDLLGD